MTTEFIKNKPLKYTLIGVGIVCAILLVTWLIVWAVTGNVNPFATVTQGSTSLESSTLSTESSTSRLGEKANIKIDECSIPTQVQMEECDVTSSVGLELLRVCSKTSNNIQYDDMMEDEKGATRYKTIGHCWSAFQEGFQTFFAPRPTTDIVIDLQNVSGQAYSMFLSTNESDDYADGFKPEQETAPNLQTMVAQYPSSSVPLVGEKPGAVLSVESPTFGFNLASPTEWKLHSDIGSWNPPSTVTDGLLRMCFQYVDYHFTLGGSAHTMRVYLSHPTIDMATKCYVNDSGQVFFIDIAEENNPVAKTSYEDCVKPLTFWNQPQINSWIGESSPSESEHVRMFKAFQIGLPIELVDKTIDLQELKNQSFTTNLLVDPSVSFREAKRSNGWNGQSWTETELIQNIAWLTIMFEIPGLNFKGLISVTE